MFVFHVMDFLIRARLSGRDDVCKVMIARFFCRKDRADGRAAEREQH
jgi:hypothetical protein